MFLSGNASVFGCPRLGIQERRVCAIGQTKPKASLSCPVLVVGDFGMARMNWENAARRERVTRAGADRVEADLHGRNKPAKKKKSRGTQSSRKTPRKNACPVDGLRHVWTEPERRDHETAVRHCAKCGKQELLASFLEVPSSGCSADHDWSPWKQISTSVFKSVCLKCGRIRKRGAPRVKRSRR